MRSGNPLDGMYLFLIIVPFVLSLWGGDLLRKKIVHHLLFDLSWSQSISILVGVSVQSAIIIFGVLTGFLLTILI